MKAKDEMVLNEGGNVFKDANGTPVTQRIKRADVDPTLAWLENITGIPHQDFKLGTTGIKSSSGDLDIAVNPKDKELAMSKLMSWVQERGLNPKEWIRKAGVNIHFKTPIRGDEKNGFVQTDLMFGDQEWMKWSMKGAAGESPFKGKHRHLMMASLAKAKNMTWSFQKGLIDRNTREIISQNPDEIAKLLIGKNATAADLESVETIWAKVKKLANSDSLTSDARVAFDKEGLTLPESSHSDALKSSHYDEIAQVKAMAGL